MKLVCLLGSPRRKGNSATVAESMIARAEELGVETETVYLNSLSYRGCQACYACKGSSDRCVLQDDLAPVLEKVRDADLLVLATPVYYGDVTGQLKNFIDRTFSYLVPEYYLSSEKTRLAPGKKMAFLLIQGHPDDSFCADIFPRYAYFMEWLGYRDPQLVRGCGISERSNVTKKTALMDLARETIDRMVGGK